MWWRECSMPTSQPHYSATWSVQNNSWRLRRQQSWETVSQINIPTFEIKQQLHWCIHSPCNIRDWRWWVVWIRTPYIGWPVLSRLLLFSFETSLLYPHFDRPTSCSNRRPRSGSEWCEDGRRWMEERPCGWVGQTAEGYSFSCFFSWTSSPWWEDAIADLVRNNMEDLLWQGKNPAL